MSAPARGDMLSTRLPGGRDRPPATIAEQRCETGRVAPRTAPARPLRSPPESRPQIFECSPRTAGPQPRDVLRLALQELRSGEWVTERSRGAANGDRTRPPRAWVSP